MITDKEEFFAAATRKVVDYTDPDSGVSIGLREMTAGQAFKLLEAISNKAPREEVCAKALIFAAVGPDGKPIFSEEDFARILDAKAGDLLAAGGKALELSGIYGTKKNGSAETADSS